jgi:hypothetical protein
MGSQVLEFKQMITRAQAEALLTLAESLEACERLGLSIEGADYGSDIALRFKEGAFLMAPDTHLTAVDIRLIVDALVPKQKD